MELLLVEMAGSTKVNFQCDRSFAFLLFAANIMGSGKPNFYV